VVVGCDTPISNYGGLISLETVGYVVRVSATFFFYRCSDGGDRFMGNVKTISPNLEEDGLESKILQ
jgi:hypothetical protein